MFKKSKKRKSEAQTAKARSISRVFLSVFLAIAALLGATAFESYILSDKNVGKAVIAKADIKAGTFIDDTNKDKYFVIDPEVDTKFITTDTYTDIADVKGKVLTNITAGEPISSNRLEDTANINEKFSDPVEISFNVPSAAKAVNGFLRKGDIVDIFGANTVDDSGSQEKAETIMKDAFIVEAYDESFNVIADNDTTTKAVNFKIYVERSNAAKFSRDIASNSFTLVKKVLPDAD